jgi:hypothetical protein
VAYSWQSILALGTWSWHRARVHRPYFFSLPIQFRDYFKTSELVGSVSERLRLDIDYLDVVSTECASLLRGASHLPFI